MFIRDSRKPFWKGFGFDPHHDHFWNVTEKISNLWTLSMVGWTIAPSLDTSKSPHLVPTCPPNLDNRHRLWTLSMVGWTIAPSLQGILQIRFPFVRQAMATILGIGCSMKSPKGVMGSQSVNFKGFSMKWALSWHLMHEAWSFQVWDHGCQGIIYYYMVYHWCFVFQTWSEGHRNKMCCMLGQVMKNQERQTQKGMEVWSQRFVNPI